MDEITRKKDIYIGVFGIINTRYFKKDGAIDIASNQLLIHVIARNHANGTIRLLCLPPASLLLMNVYQFTFGK